METIYRTYSITYGNSATTGDSCLTQVKESSLMSGQKMDLLPPNFTYTQLGVDPPNLFTLTTVTDAFKVVKNSIGVVPLNLTGRALPDLAFMDWDAGSTTLTVKTYYADRQADGKTVAWTASPSNVPVTLPKLAPATEASVFMTLDLQGDGRLVLIIPSQNDGGKLKFFLP